MGIEVCENMSWNFQVQSKSTDSVLCDKMIYFRTDVKTKVIFVVVVVVVVVVFVFFVCVCVCITVSGYVPPQCKINISHADWKPRAANSIPLLDRAMPSKETPQHRQGIFLPAQRIFTIPPASRIPSAFPLHPSQDFGKWSCSPVITCYLRPALLQRCHPIC